MSCHVMSARITIFTPIIVFITDPPYITYIDQSLSYHLQMSIHLIRHFALVYLRLTSSLNITSTRRWYALPYTSWRCRVGGDLNAGSTAPTTCCTPPYSSTASCSTHSSGNTYINMFVHLPCASICACLPA